MENNKKLFVGLDIGTDSVGWAATDENFKLRRLKGKTAWGARIFEEANDAKTRRVFRTNGRRLARRKERIRLLNTIFDPLIKKVDPTFLMRLENSYLSDLDPNKKEEFKDLPLLFISKTKEKEFYKSYPTIWHLREAQVLDEKGAFDDIRYLYLTIHHILKYRGNFLTEGEIKTGDFTDECLDNFNDYLSNIVPNIEDDEDGTPSLPKEKYADFKKECFDQGKGKTAKRSELMTYFDVTPESKPFITMFCTLIAGGTFSSSKLAGLEEVSDVKIQFSSKYEEEKDTIRGTVGEDIYSIIEIAKYIYDCIDLRDILRTKQWLSSAFVTIYNSHKEQLTALKKICKYIDKKNNLTNENSTYWLIFAQKDSDKNYPSFVHHNVVDGNKRAGIDVFNKFVLETITPYETCLVGEDLKNWKRINELIEQKEFLQIIANRSTGVIPMQLHKNELVAILDNAIKHNIEGIKENKDKIVKLFTFKIPYYCGPLGKNSQYSNVVFKNSEKKPITPWNFENEIDFDATKKVFMEGLTNKCTYLKDKNVLPLGSILYQDYNVWNKLNNLTVNGSKLTKDEKGDLFKMLLSHRNKTTMKDIKRYLKNRSASKDADITISGWNENDFIDCSSRATLGKVFDLSSRYSKDFEICEKIIYLKTIFTDSPNDALSSIKRDYPSLSNEQLAAIKQLKLKGWAPFSKDFLLLISNKDGNQHVLIDLLEEGSENLMQLINSKYGFDELIKKHNEEVFANKTDKEAVREMIDNMPPKMRRPVIQAVRIVEEVSKVAKQKPDVICLEVTRENNDAQTKKKKEKDSRFKQLNDFLNTLCKNPQDKENATELKEELSNIDINKIQGKHLYLYFLQNGRDLYSGKRIDINDILKSNKYDTDHIIPQSFMKDDSIDNLVLVLKETNQHRSNQFPVPVDRSNKELVAFWRRLKKAKMMSDKKFNNLMRTTELTEDELNGFVNAQINVVNQANIVIRDVLNKLYPEATLIFSKAMYPSLVRQVLSIPKLRDLNDTHHAVDAYLNVICGSTLYNKFSRLGYIKSHYKKDENFSLNMERYVKHLVLEDKEGILTDLGVLIKQNSQKHDFLLTYRFKYQDSDFYKQTLFAPKSNMSLIPTHEDRDSSIYGGYSQLSLEYNVIATITSKKKSYRYFLSVPHLYAEQLKSGSKPEIINKLIELVPHKKGEEVKIDFTKQIPLMSVVKKDGVQYCLMTKGNQISLFPISPIFLDDISDSMLKLLENLCNKNVKEMESKENSISIVTNKEGSSIKLTKENILNTLNLLFQKASEERYSFCSPIKELGNYDVQANLIKLVNEGTYKECNNVLRTVYSIFTRKSRSIGNKIFLKSRLNILAAGLMLVQDSITGLYSKEIKL